RRGRRDRFMLRRVMAVLALSAAIVGMAVYADAPATPKDDTGVPNDTVIKQATLKRQFQEFEQALLRLAQRLEKSPRQDDRDKAQALRKAIKLAEQEAVENRFQKLLATLQDSNAVSVTEIRKAVGQNEELIKVLSDMLDLLLTDNEAQKLKEERERIQKLLEQLDKLIRDEKLVRSKIDSGRTEANNLVKDQQKV